MKKTITIIIILSLSLAVQAQDGQRPYNLFQDPRRADDLTTGVFTLLGFALLAVCFITILRSILGHRLKSKMIEKGVSENLASKFLDTTRKSTSTITMKWFIILCGIGAGLSLVEIFTPYGLHSLAIMVFCIAGSFLGFYYFLKKSGE